MITLFYLAFLYSKYSVCTHALDNELYCPQRSRYNDAIPRHILHPLAAIAARRCCRLCVYVLLRHPLPRGESSAPWR